MAVTNKKVMLRLKRHRSIRLKMTGTAARPRVVITRSLKHFSALAVDDVANRTLMSLSTFDKGLKAKVPSGGNLKAAEALGVEFARQAKEKGITAIVFDRAGHLYHGRVKSFAEALRKGGLQF